MTEKTNNKFVKNLGLLALWIVCGLVWIKSGSVAFMIVPFIYTINLNLKQENSGNE